MQIIVTSYRPKKQDFSPKTGGEGGKKTSFSLKTHGDARDNFITTVLLDGKKIL